MAETTTLRKGVQGVIMRAFRSRDYSITVTGASAAPKTFSGSGPGSSSLAASVVCAVAGFPKKPMATRPAVSRSSERRANMESSLRNTDRT